MQTPLKIGTILSGRYRVERVIGMGGFGITYAASHVSLGTKFAIKEFYIEGKCMRLADNVTVTYQDMEPGAFEKFRKRFHDEAITLCQLDNSHVVHVHDIFDENGTTYILMDFVVGETLQKKVEREGALPYDLAVNYMAQLCEAVEHIHSHHILHRDIKPENIIITPQNNVVLIDFGSARSFVHDQEQKHTAMITVGYAPIEQYTATSKKGNYTDIYAMGATFYFILTGKKPIPAADRVINDELQEPISFNATIPPSASRTIMRALNVKPEDRYQSVTEFQRDLLEISDVSAKESSSISTENTSTTNVSNTKKVFWGLILGLLIALLIAVTIGLMFQKSSEQNVVPIVSDVEKVGYQSELSERRLTRTDLFDKSEEELSIMRNSIYARHGYAFKGGKFYEHFSQFSWYDPIEEDADRVFLQMSDIEQYNVKFIKNYEKELKAINESGQEEPKIGPSLQKMEIETEDVQSVLDDFAEYDCDDDIEGLSMIYAPYLDRYFNKRNVSREEVLENHQNYNERFGVFNKEISFRWETLRITPISSNRVEVVCVIDYHIDREDKSKPTDYVIEKHFMFDQNYQISSVYDVQLEKY